MRAVIQAAIRPGGGGAHSGALGDDDNAAGRRLGADPRRRRSTGHGLGALPQVRGPIRHARCPDAYGVSSITPCARSVVLWLRVVWGCYLRGAPLPPRSPVSSRAPAGTDEEGRLCRRNRASAPSCWLTAMPAPPGVAASLVPGP